MRFIKVSVFALLASLSLRTASAQTLYTCGEGTVRSVEVITEIIARSPIVVTIDPLGEPQELVQRPPDEPHQAVLVTVQLFNGTYTAEAFAADPENFDATQLQKDAAIATCVSGDQLILNRDDGTDFRARIVRSERVRRTNGTR